MEPDRYSCKLEVLIMFETLLAIILGVLTSIGVTPDPKSADPPALTKETPSSPEGNQPSTKAGPWTEPGG